MAATYHRLSILNEQLLSISVPFTSRDLFNSIKCNTVSHCGSSCLSVSEELAHCSWWHKVLLHLPRSAASFVWGAVRIPKWSTIFYSSVIGCERDCFHVWQNSVLLFISAEHSSLMYNSICSLCFATSSRVHFNRDNHLYSQLLSFHLYISSVSVMLKTFAYIDYSLLFVLKLLWDFDATRSLTHSALFPLPFNFFTCERTLKFSKIHILFCSLCLAASSGVSCHIDNLLYILPFSNHLSTFSNDWRCSKLSHIQPTVSSFPLYWFFCFGCPTLCFVQALQWNYSSISLSNLEIQAFNAKLAKITKTLQHAALFQMDFHRKHFTKHGFHLNNAGKEELAKLIASQIDKLISNSFEPMTALKWKEDPTNEDINTTDYHKPNVVSSEDDFSKTMTPPVQISNCQGDMTDNDSFRRTSNRQKKSSCH